MTLTVALTVAFVVAGFAAGITWRDQHPTSPPITEIVPCGGTPPHPAQPQ